MLGITCVLQTRHSLIKMYGMVCTQALKSNHCYPSKIETDLKGSALSRIEALAQDWVKKVTIAKGYQSDVVRSAVALVEASGSYRLKVDSPGMTFLGSISGLFLP